MIEAFGCIGVRLNTPYTRLVKYYSSQEWDMIGLYYPVENGSELVLYDVYSSCRIRGVTFLGELLLWESVLEISTKKFYSDNEDVQAAIASLIVADFGQAESALRELVINDQYTSRICTLFEQRLHRFSAQQSAESIYQRTSMGVKCSALDKAYEALHDCAFRVLKELNANLYDIFRRKPSVTERVVSYPLINRLYSFLRQNKGGLPSHFTIDQSELDLGESSFRISMVVDYNKQHSSQRQLELKCTNFSVILSGANTDLSFLDKKALLEILRYIEACEDGSFSQLEEQILTEIANRDNADF